MKRKKIPLLAALTVLLLSTPSDGLAHHYTYMQESPRGQAQVEPGISLELGGGYVDGRVQ
jgi:hypothetical protein